MKKVKQNSKAKHAQKVKQISDHWGRGESNSHASRHMILSHACLPVPALPQAQRNVTFYHFGWHYAFLEWRPIRLDSVDQSYVSDTLFLPVS
jgi:hypothetical protein